LCDAVDIEGSLTTVLGVSGVLLWLDLLPRFLSINATITANNANTGPSHSHNDDDDDAGVDDDENTINGCVSSNESVVWLLLVDVELLLSAVTVSLVFMSKCVVAIGVVVAGKAIFVVVVDDNDDDDDDDDVVVVVVVVVVGIVFVVVIAVLRLAGGSDNAL